MDSQFIEHLHTQLAGEYPRLVEVLGEFGARTELEASLGHLVTNMVLDPIDAQELLDRLILPQYVPFQHDIPDTRTGYDLDGNFHVGRL